MFNCCYNTLASLAYITIASRLFVPLVLLLVFHTEDSLRKLFHLTITWELFSVTDVYYFRFTLVITWAYSSYLVVHNLRWYLVCILLYLLSLPILFHSYSTPLVDNLWFYPPPPLASLALLPGSFGRIPAALKVGVLWVTAMFAPSTLASIIAVTLHTLGFALGCLIWAAIGYGFGSLLGYPVVGALSGIAYQLAAYVALHDAMWASLSRSRDRFALLLDRWALCRLSAAFFLCVLSNYTHIWLLIHTSIRSVNRLLWLRLKYVRWCLQCDLWRFHASFMVAHLSASMTTSTSYMTTSMVCNTLPLNSGYQVICSIT